jgi:glycosyltransferase involved in cell wall biosynthesis
VTPHLRIAIVKPDFRVTGGFELVMARVDAELRERGHTTTWHTVDTFETSRSPFGLDVPPAVWAAGAEYFRYLSLVEAFRRVDPGDADVVISTQPPSFAVEHERVLALFSHHLRIYYDLSDAYVEAGFVDADLHRAAEAGVREVDQPLLHAVRHFLAASPEVKRRLARFNGLDENVGIYLAGIAFRRDVGSAAGSGGDGGDGHVLCVSRHEWPKRTELFVAAMKHLPARRGTLVGTGGRLAWAKTIDAKLTASGADLEAVDSRSLWMNKGEIAPAHALEPPRRSNVRFLGHVPDAKLDRLFSSALCVVAPAYLEDYGLTAIEAMAYGKPLVVCRDGGGLTDSVQDGVNGFVVDPEPSAIADAVRRLADDPDLARTMGANARDIAATYTWDRAMAQIESGIEQVLS